MTPPACSTPLEAWQGSAHAKDARLRPKALLRLQRFRAKLNSLASDPKSALKTSRTLRATFPRVGHSRVHSPLRRVATQPRQPLWLAAPSTFSPFEPMTDREELVMTTFNQSITVIIFHEPLFLIFSINTMDTENTQYLHWAYLPSIVYATAFSQCRCCALCQRLSLDLKHSVTSRHITWLWSSFVDVYLTLLGQGPLHSRLHQEISENYIREIFTVWHSNIKFY